MGSQIGFSRRYNYQPTVQQIQQIEGVIVVDNAPPGVISGAGEGTACCVGEFPDCTFSVQPDGAGNLTTNYQPQRVFGQTDGIAKFGGFDSTIGDFGISGGNGFVDAFKSKQWSALVCVAVNIASAKGARLTRALPTNASATNPVPAVAMSAGTVLASTEFTDSGGLRARVAGAQVFTGSAAYASGTDAVETTDASGATHVVTAASFAALITAKTVRAGDIIVLGVIGDATYGTANMLGPYHGTFRVRTVGATNTLTLEALDGSSWATTAQSTIPWRLHEAASADTAGGGQPGNVGAVYATAAAFTVPMRPLDAALGNSDIAPLTVPLPVPTASSWDPLSDLRLLAGSTGLDYTAAIQAPNAVASASWDALYTAALASLLGTTDPAPAVNVVWCARTSATIRLQGNAHANLASSKGVGRVFISAPELSVQTVAAATSSSSPGVGANRSERVDYAWPGANVFVAEAVNATIATAVAGKTTTDGNLDVRMDGFVASIYSVLAPFRNPAQNAPPVGGDGGVLSVINGLQRGAPTLTIDSYSFLRAQGVMALHIDSDFGPEIVSGVTTSLIPGTTNANRRRMHDFIDDSISAGLKPFSKLPVSKALSDAALAEVDNFLADLLSADSPSNQQIAGYSAALTSSPSMLAQGIFQVSVSVQMLPTADFIVLQTSVSPLIQISFNVGSGGVTSG